MVEKQRILVLYVIQMGNVQDVVECVGWEVVCYYFKFVVEFMYLYDFSKFFQEKIVIFVVLIIGQGDLLEFMRVFWKFLFCRSFGFYWLELILFFVFGLGDFGYQKYNIIGKKFDRRLLDLGGMFVVFRGLGDD